MIGGTKIQGELLGSLRGVPYLRKMKKLTGEIPKWGETQQLCPEWHYHSDDLGGVCTPIKKTFKQWVETTGIGEYIPVPSSKLITHADFVDTVNSTLKDLVVMNEIKEEMCKEIESREKVREYIESDMKLRHGSDIFERAKDWQKKYMEVMASYFR